MKGKSILLAICVALAAALLSTVLYVFHTQGYMNIWLFYLGWAIAVYGVVRFYSDKKPHDTHHDHDDHDHGHHHDGHDGHPQPQH
jgi:ABC-type nickel/cobalt efflux system permease component RcnA